VVAAWATVALVAELVVPQGARACTAARLWGPRVLDGVQGAPRGAAAGPVVVKSYDWDNDLGVLYVNPRGLAKHAFPALFGANARWTSRYASVTFNQYGRGLPNGGMNEAGLVIEVLWLRGTEPPPASDPRPAVNELQWIQLHLDTTDTIPALIASARRHRVARVYADVHYFACDATGACATFEYLDGSLVVHRGAALANDPYAVASRWARAHPDAAATQRGRSSLLRFARAARAAAAPAHADVVGAAHALLGQVSQGRYTQWQILYEPAARRVSFRSRRAPAWKTLRLSALPAAALRCGAGPRWLELNAADLSGDVARRLRAYDPAQNGRLARESFRRLGAPLPGTLIRTLAAVPDRFSCASP